MKQQNKPKYNLLTCMIFMLKTAWSREKSVLFLSIAIALTTAMQSITELFMAPTILQCIENQKTLSELLISILFFALALCFFTGLKSYLNNNTLFGRVSLRMHILTQLADKAAGTSYPNLLNTAFTNLLSKSQDHCSANASSTEACWNSFTDILSLFFSFLVYLALLGNLNPILVGVVILTSVLGFFINRKLNTWDYIHREEEAAHVKKLMYIRTVTTDRKYAKDIRIFGLENWIEDLWNTAARLYYAFMQRRETNYLWTNVVDLVLSFFRNGFAYAYLIHQTLTQGMTASDFLLYFTAISSFSGWVTKILDKCFILYKQSLDISVILEVLNWEECFIFEKGKSIPKADNYELKMEHVSFRYNEAETNTLTDINLTIHPGENIAVVGLNGAGKTTLVKILCGFLDPTEGRVLLNNEDIKLFNRKEYYELFSAVFQDFSLLSGSLAESVAQNKLNIDSEKVWKCLEQAGLKETVTSYSDKLNTKIGREVYAEAAELSGGQTQRLMLARALYKDGAILILDEPTAALDPIAENDIYLKYNEMTKGKTSLFISHRLASTRFCNRILFLEKGCIAEEGTHDSLLSKGGKYAALFEIQSKYYKEGEKEYA